MRAWHGIIPPPPGFYGPEPCWSPKCPCERYRVTTSSGVTVTTGKSAEQIPADEVLPGDEILAEDTWAQVRSSNVYDGWVSIVVAGMDLRYAIGEKVWVNR